MTDLTREYPICFASLFMLRKIKDTKTSRHFVWPDEGDFDEDGLWEFNEEHADFDPLWVDPTTASALVLVYEALEKEATREKFEHMIAQHRGTFGLTVEFAWKHVSPK
jgi:hypothetical protein